MTTKRVIPSFMEEDQGRRRHVMIQTSIIRCACGAEALVFLIAFIANFPHDVLVWTDQLKSYARKPLHGKSTKEISNDTTKSPRMRKSQAIILDLVTTIYNDGIIMFLDKKINCLNSNGTKKINRTQT